MKCEEIREKNKHKSPMEELNKVSKEYRVEDYGHLWSIKPRTIKKLNVDKIQSLDDVKRVIAALDIKFELTKDTYNKAYELVKDLCD